MSITLAPQNPVVDAEGQTIAMQVLARYTDGSERDVTAEAFIESGELEIASADKAGHVTAIRRGEAPLLARYEGAYAATTLTVMGDRTGFESSPQPIYNDIDELVDAKLARMKIAASGLCTDAEFLRRVYLDLTGLPPTADEVRAFLADPSESRAKRDALVDQLIGSDDFVEHWTNKWADLLQVNRKFLGGEGAAGFRDWIRAAIAENRPTTNSCARSSPPPARTASIPPASYFKVLRTPDLMRRTRRSSSSACASTATSATTIRSSAGRRTSTTAGGVLRRGEAGEGSRERRSHGGGSAVEAAQPLFEMITDAPGGEMIHLRTSQPAPPKFPFEVSTGVR